MWWNDFKPIAANHFPRCDATLDKYFTDYACLQLISSGSVTIHYDDERYALTGAWVWPHHDGPRIRLRPSQQDGYWEHRYFAFQTPMLHEWQAAGLWPDRPQQVHNIQLFIELFDLYRTAFERMDALTQAECGIRTEQVLLALAQQRRQQQPAWLQHIRAQLANGHVDDFDARKLAASVHMAPSTLRRQFQHVTGQSLRDYAVTVRLRQAARALLASQQSVGSIALQFGYCDNAAFSRQFKHYYGMTPSQYRRDFHSPSPIS